MSFITYRGHALYYEIIPNPTATKTVALLHGDAVSSKLFAPVLKLYTQKYSVFLIDFLGYGKSDRLTTIPIDLWQENSEQLIYLTEKVCHQKIDLIGTSGGAVVALNAALARPDLWGSIVADSLVGFTFTPQYLEFLENERAHSKKSLLSRIYLRYQQGKDWRAVLDNDTEAIRYQARTAPTCIHGDPSLVQVPVLFTASKEDTSLQTGTVYEEIIELSRINPLVHYHFFQKGNHPSLLSNSKDFIHRVDAFLNCSPDD